MSTNGRLAILVPSRGRPLTFARFLESWAADSAGVSDIILRNGSFDPLVDSYLDFEGFPNLIRYVGNDAPYKDSMTGNAGYLPAQQEMWERFPGYAAYLSIEDDCVFEEKGFDKKILAQFLLFPNRCGMLRLHDHSDEIECYAFSDVWCNALGYLWPDVAGETGFKVMPVIAEELIRKGPAFRHLPLLRSHGYTGNERSGSLEIPGIVEKFMREGMRMESWFQTNAKRMQKKIHAAAYGGTQ